jgi:hypothetical protein
VKLTKGNRRKKRNIGKKKREPSKTAEIDGVL